MIASVWAPDAGAVACRLGAAPGSPEVAMTRGDDGWWAGPELADGTDYAFVVDGAGPFPDPRGARLPDGVHGPSRVFDIATHAWTDGEWRGVDALGAVTYELHVGTFTRAGTLDSAAAALPRLASVGIQMVELMPLAPMPGERGWGYDGVSVYAVHEPYGGPAALQRFVDAAHRLGLGVTLDVVYNHLGPDGNYLGPFGPYFTDAYETPWGWAVNLDHDGSVEVRRYLIDNALRWFRDFHVDALRLDAVHELHDHSDRHFLAQLSDETAALAADLGRVLSLVAESDLNDATMIAPTADGGRGMTAQWDDDVHHALHAYLTGERHGYYSDFGSVEALDKAYRKVFVHDGEYSTFRGKNWGAPVPPGVDRRRFVVCAANHDQVGNRALGDRPSASLSPGAQAASLAFVLLSPFTPMLFMGEEYGETRPFQFFTDHAPTLGADVTAGRLDEFGGHGWEDLYGGPIEVPDPQDRATFLRSVIDTAEASQGVHARLAQWVAELMGARPSTLVPGAWDRHPVGVSEDAPRVVTLTGPVTVRANLSNTPVRFEARDVGATFGLVTTGDGVVTVGPDSVALIINEPRGDA